MAELKCKEASSSEMGVSGGLPLTEVRSKIVWEESKVTSLWVCKGKRPLIPGLQSLAYTTLSPLPSVNLTFPSRPSSPFLRPSPVSYTPLLSSPSLTLISTCLRKAQRHQEQKCTWSTMWRLKNLKNLKSITVLNLWWFSSLNHGSLKRKIQ